MSHQAPSTAAGQRRHRFMLLVSSAVVILALVLDVPSEHRVEFRYLPGLALPQTCMSRSLFGVECPGCGLTRSLIHLAHGRWQASWEVHRLGWLIAAAVLIQFPYRIVGLLRKQDAPLGRRIPEIFGLTLIFLLIANWLLGYFW